MISFTLIQLSLMISAMLEYWFFSSYITCLQYHYSYKVYADTTSKLEESSASLICHRRMVLQYSILSRHICRYRIGYFSRVYPEIRDCMSGTWQFEPIMILADIAPANFLQIVSCSFSGDCTTNRCYVLARRTM